VRRLTIHSAIADKMRGARLFLLSWEIRRHIGIQRIQFPTRPGRWRYKKAIFSNFYWACTKCAIFLLPIIVLFYVNKYISICMPQQNPLCHLPIPNHVLYYNGPILLSFRDMTMGRTTNNRQRTDDGNHCISRPSGVVVVVVYGMQLMQVSYKVSHV